MENRLGAKFCKGCGISLTVHASAAGRDLDPQPQADTESRFHALPPEVIAFVQRNRRVLYRELKHIFGLDDVMLVVMKWTRLCADGL